MTDKEIKMWQEDVEMIKKLNDRVKELENKINKYENPDDLTLFYMWINEKAKDKMKELQQRIDKAIEYMKYNATSNYFDEEKNMFRREIDLLEILEETKQGG